MNDIVETELKALFNENYLTYYFKSWEFFHAATKLEQIANIGDQTWSDEMKILDVKSGEKFTPTTKLQFSEYDRRCRNISIYLYAHSLELLMKGLLFEKKNKPKHIHKISEIYDEIKEFMSLSPKDINDILQLILIVEETIVWAGRYPAPKPKRNIRQYATVNHNGNDCITNNPETIFRDKLPLLKTFYKYLGSLSNAGYWPKKY